MWNQNMFLKFIENLIFKLKIFGGIFFEIIFK
jgi:hypothetical protein